MRGLPLITLLLALAPAAAGAQEAVLLRLAPPVGQSTPYRTDLTVWLRTPLLSTDTVSPTATLRLYQRRTVTASDAAVLVFTDVTDSSSLAFPAFGGGVPVPGATGDLMRGLATETRIEAGGRGVATRLVAAPALPPGMPGILRGVVSLALTSTRLSTFALPDRPVRPGDTWTDSLRYDLERTPGLEETSLALGGIGTARIHFERLRVRSGRRIASLVAVAEADASTLEGGASATMRLTGTARIDLDLDAGRLERSEMDLAGSMLTRAGLVPVRLHLTQQAR